MKEIIAELKSLFKDLLIPIRLDRSNKIAVGKYRNRLNPNITKNHKNNLGFLNLISLNSRQ